jgi:predicted nuclease of predicted toxin-antitoxin system
MLRLLVDEDLPRSLARDLRAAGHVATDVRDEGLRGQPDRRIFDVAQKLGFVLLTGDVEFGNELVYPPAGHRGVVLTRFPSHLPVTTLVQQIVAGVEVVANENLDGAIVVIEPGRVRVRRAKARI